MNHSELVAAVAAKNALTKADATKLVDAVFATITETVKGGTDVKVKDFGIFTTVKTKAGTGRNPRTGETIERPAATKPKFKAAKALKDAVA